MGRPRQAAADAAAAQRLHDPGHRLTLRTAVAWHYGSVDRTGHRGSVDPSGRQRRSTLEPVAQDRAHAVNQVGIIVDHEALGSSQGGGPDESVVRRFPGG